MPAKDKVQETEGDSGTATDAGTERSPQPKQLTREQLEAVRRKLQKKFH